MAKDFRNVSKLPDDFVNFDFAEDGGAKMVDAAETAFSKEEYERLYRLNRFDGPVIDTDMVGTKAKIEKAAMDIFKANNPDADLSGITIESTEPKWLSYCKDGVEFARSYGAYGVNDKYIEYDSDEQFPMIPQKDGYEEIGCSWIDNADNSWEDFEKVEKALMENKALEDSFAAGIDSIPEQTEGMEQ